MHRTQPTGARPALARPAAARIRPASRKDAAALSDFVGGLSMRSQFLRFFGSVSPPSASLLRALTGADGRSDVLLATRADGTVIGHAMAADRVDGSGCLVSDIGLVVADSAQRQGIGARLLTTLVTRAAGRGVRALVMDIQPGNDQMLAMIERRWPAASRVRTADSIHIRSSLSGAGPAAAAWPPAPPPSKGDHHAAARPAA